MTTVTTVVATPPSSIVEASSLVVCQKTWRSIFFDYILSISPDNNADSPLTSMFALGKRINAVFPMYVYITPKREHHAVTLREVNTSFILSM